MFNSNMSCRIVFHGKNDLSKSCYGNIPPKFDCLVLVKSELTKGINHGIIFSNLFL